MRTKQTSRRGHFWRRLYVIRTLLALGIVQFVLPAVAQPSSSCESLLTKKHASEQEREYWSSSPEASAILGVAQDTASRLDVADQDVLALLTMVLDDGFAADPDTLAIRKAYSQWPDLAFFETVFENELHEVAPIIAGLFYVAKYSQGDTQKWFQDFLQSGRRAFVLASILRTYPRNSMVINPQISNDWKKYNKIREVFLTRIQPLVPPNATLLSIARDSPLLLKALVSEAIITRSAVDHRREVNRRYNQAGGHFSTEDLMSADTEDFAEWFMGHLQKYQVPHNDMSAPREWRERSLSIWPWLSQRILSPDRKRSVYSLTVLALLTNRFLRHLKHAFSDELGVQDISAIPISPKWILEHFFREENTPPTITARFVNLISALIGMKFTNAQTLKTTIKGRLALTMATKLKEYFPVPVKLASVPFGEHEIKPTPAEILESDPIQIGDPSFQGQIADTEINLDHVPAELPGPEDLSSLGGDEADLSVYAAGELPVSQLVADKLYHVRFVRTGNKFLGPQKVLFKKSALFGLQTMLTKEVSPRTWLKALERGLAANEGQRGIKFLRARREKALVNGLPIELKLLLSPMRLMGHYKDGVFIFERMQDPH